MSSKTKPREFFFFDKLSSFLRLIWLRKWRSAESLILAVCTQLALCKAINGYFVAKFTKMCSRSIRTRNSTECEVRFVSRDSRKTFYIFFNYITIFTKCKQMLVPFETPSAPTFCKYGWERFFKLNIREKIMSLWASWPVSYVCSDVYSARDNIKVWLRPLISSGQ